VAHGDWRAWMMWRRE